METGPYVLSLVGSLEKAVLFFGIRSHGKEAGEIYDSVGLYCVLGIFLNLLVYLILAGLGSRHSYLQVHEPALEVELGLEPRSL